MEAIEVGDRVKVITEVWDDSREKSWQGWEGVVESLQDPLGQDPYWVFVFFPKARGKYRRYDFLPEELERIV